MLSNNKLQDVLARCKVSLQECLNEQARLETKINELERLLEELRHGDRFQTPRGIVVIFKKGEETWLCEDFTGELEYYLSTKMIQYHVYMKSWVKIGNVFEV